jgi:putative NADPH-quinone reductase
MKVVILYVHPEPEASFQAALFRKGVETLELQGHEVVVSDLYKMEFNPVALVLKIFLSDAFLNAYSMTVSRSMR